MCYLMVLEFECHCVMASFTFVPPPGLQARGGPLKVQVCEDRPRTTGARLEGGQHLLPMFVLSICFRVHHKVTICFTLCVLMLGVFMCVSHYPLIRLGQRCTAAVRAESIVPYI